MSSVVRNRMKGAVGAAFTAFALLLFGVGDAYAQEGTVAGTVTAAETLSPLAGAQVRIDDTNQGAFTDEQGRYSIAGVPAGAHTVRVQLLGYGVQTREVQVNAGDVTTADFALEVSAAELDELVVTVTGAERKRELANAVVDIDVAELPSQATISNVFEAIQGRAAGVEILSSGGTTGAGTRIRIRGSGSVSLSNEPVVVVDGVRVDNDPTAFTIGIGGQDVSALSTLNPNNIESIEIVKGPSATTLYGTKAANGVIRVTTKRGTAQGPAWHAYVEGGIITEPNEYPANFLGLTAGGDACFLFLAAAGACDIASVQSFNLFENEATTPFRTGDRQVYGLNVSGASGTFNYFLSGQFGKENGIYANNNLDDVNLRANFGSQVSDNFNVQVRTGYISRDLTLPQNDNNTLGILPQGFLGGASEDGFFAFPFETIMQIEDQAQVERFIGSVNANWTPIDWLTVGATVGSDVVNRFNTEFFAPGVIDFGTLILGNRSADRVQSRIYTGGLRIQATRDITERLGSQTSVGLQYDDDTSKGLLANGEELVSGSNSLTSAALTEATEFTVVNKTLGAYIEEQLSWNDRLFLTGAVRADDNSAFGQDFSLIIYPKVGASWVISEEPFFPDSDVLSSLRLRGAYGESGNQPGTNDAVQFLVATAITTPGDEDAIGVTFDGGGLGNPDLEPERSTEFEAGFDAGFWQDRLNLGVTLYQKTTYDLLVQREVAPSLGTNGVRFENLGTSRNKGVEAVLDAIVLRQENVELDVGISASYNHNELLELGEGITPISFGLGANTQRFEAGHPLGAYHARPYTFEDANGDGIIGIDEVTVADEPVFFGQPFPKTNVSVRLGLRLFDRIRLAGLADYSGGHQLYNATGDFRCLLANARAFNDPSAPLAEQARCIANTFGGSVAGFFEDADYAKLRELSLTFFVPQDWANYLQAADMSVTLAGRNLATWTDYSGVDPEINGGGGANFSTFDFFTQPPIRTFSARIDVSF